MQRFSMVDHVAAIGVSASRKTIDGEYSTHWHEFYEIEYIISGEGDYVIDGVSYPISEGMLFLMTPLSFHSVNAHNCTVFNVMFSEQLCNAEYLARILEKNQRFVFLTPREERGLLELLLFEIVSETKDEIHLSYVINALLGKALKLSSPLPKRSKPIGTAIAYLLRNFRRAPTLEETASYVGFAPTYFSALFKKETGECFLKYLDRLRFEYARKLLLTTEVTVREVCAESGFEDYPNFIRRFKKRYGISPGEIRKEKQKKGLSH